MKISLCKVENFGSRAILTWNGTTRAFPRYFKDENVFVQFKENRSQIHIFNSPQPFFLKFKQWLTRHGPEATPETLKFFATEVAFQESIYNIMIDNVATCESRQDFDILKTETEKFHNSTLPMTELLGFKEIEHRLNSMIITFDPIADEQKTASSILGNIGRTKFWSRSNRATANEESRTKPSLNASVKRHRRVFKRVSECTSKPERRSGPLTSLSFEC